MDTEPAQRAARELRWSEAYTLLEQIGVEHLAAEDVELLADAAWWCCKVEEEIGLRQQAFNGFTAAGQPSRAAYAAWLLAVRHGLRGQPTVASGWLRRAQRRLADEPVGVVHGYVACSEVEHALGEGRVDAAQANAARAVALGARFADPDLAALAMTWQGLCRMVQGDVPEGLGLLDEAMASVAAGELHPHFTGWVSCFAIGICMGVADLQRAGNWAQAAWDWASSLPEATPYQGLCRVRQVEVMCLRGQLQAAKGHSQRACEEMMSFEPHLAGEAFYVTGEILRRTGDLDAAEQAFAQAQELGHDPQPGLARIRLAQGQVAAAGAALRAALADLGRPPYQRAALLAARVEVALAADDLPTAAEASEQLAATAAEVPSHTLAAMAAMARGRIRLHEGDADAALTELGAAATTWRALELTAELTETRLLTGLARRDLGDEEGACAELDAARVDFERMGATADAQRTASLLGDADALPRGLTGRERQVLALVAAGRTNRQIAAELVVSEHTVARHLSNIFTKLDVSSRTAAAAFAFAHDLADP